MVVTVARVAQCEEVLRVYLREQRCVKGILEQAHLLALCAFVYFDEFPWRSRPTRMSLVVYVDLKRATCRWR